MKNSVHVLTPLKNDWLRNKKNNPSLRLFWNAWSVLPFWFMWRPPQSYHCLQYGMLFMDAICFFSVIGKISNTSPSLLPLALWLTSASLSWAERIHCRFVLADKVGHHLHPFCFAFKWCQSRIRGGGREGSVNCGTKDLGWIIWFGVQTGMG